MDKTSVTFSTYTVANVGIRPYGQGFSKLLGVGIYSTAILHDTLKGVSFFNFINNRRGIRGAGTNDGTYLRFRETV